MAVFFPPFNNVSSTSNDDNSNNDNINVLDGELTWGLCIYHLKAEPDSKKFTGGIDTSRFIGDIMYT